MSIRTIEQTYRIFLLVVAATVFAITPIELWFEEHTESVIQLIPFVFCGISLITIIAVLVAPGRGVLKALRFVMVVVTLGSLFGIYEHVEHNFEFEREIRPAAGTGTVFWEALSGASPLLAPGILALGAVLAMAATYRHPALASAQAAHR